MELTALKRSFSFNGLKLPEPDERMSVEEVKAFCSKCANRKRHNRHSSPRGRGNPIGSLGSASIGSGKAHLAHRLQCITSGWETAPHDSEQPGGILFWIGTTL